MVVGMGFVVELTFLNGRGKLRARRLLAAAIRQMSAPRAGRRVRALAKINLDLRVLGKRPDGYHELRTIFQTISLADTLEIAFTPARKTAIELADALEIRRQPGGARGAAGDGCHARHRAGRDAADQAHSHGRGPGRRIERCGGGAAGAAGAGGPRRWICRSCVRIGAAAGQRRSVLSAGRHGGGDRPRHGAVSAARRAGAAAAFWWLPASMSTRPRPIAS